MKRRQMGGQQQKIDESRTTKVTAGNITDRQVAVGDDNTLIALNPETVKLTQDLQALIEDFSQDYNPNTERG